MLAVSTVSTYHGFLVTSKYIALSCSLPTSDTEAPNKELLWERLIPQAFNLSFAKYKILIKFSSTHSPFLATFLNVCDKYNKHPANQPFSPDRVSLNSSFKYADISLFQYIGSQE